MKTISCLLMSILLSAVTFTVAAGSPSLEPARQPDCTIGPLKKTYGGVHWLVYGCAGGRDLKIVSAPDVPTMAFYFFFAHSSKGMRLYGEGNGEDRVTDAAYKELKLLSVGDVASLYQQAAAGSH
ncbi:hypothetical protein PY254_00950 [Rhodanobacter sp. AS-Z3]|uniref:hypothetical protein n=1 Tax=Rhodanobacter sp. AS-Z3 TaxID=3031330 RepID=UPI0024794F08|nr:hypothetical protein [Rhodanobacter sp. AS-Z3]WEN15280.1 hypothetical protein PY254_00950 [Rhodanobacter sp. AS-Z3]